MESSKGLTKTKTNTPGKKESAKLVFKNLDQRGVKRGERGNSNLMAGEAIDKI